MLPRIRNIREFERLETVRFKFVSKCYLLWTPRKQGTFLQGPRSRLGTVGPTSNSSGRILHPLQGFVTTSGWCQHVTMGQSHCCSSCTATSCFEVETKGGRPATRCSALPDKTNAYAKLPAWDGRLASAWASSSFRLDMASYSPRLAIWTWHWWVLCWLVYSPDRVAGADFYRLLPVSHTILRLNLRIWLEVALEFCARNTVPSRQDCQLVA